MGAGEVEIATWDLGGDGPPLLLTHGNGLHAKTWLPVAPVLRRHFRLIAVDQRGHGMSGHASPADYLDWSRFADDLIAVVDTLGLGDAATGLVGAGHSLGGAALILAEQRRPGMFAGLYCFEPIIISTAQRAPGSRFSDAQLALAELTRKRRATFPSRRAARVNYAGKLPFSRMRADALDAYVEHGLHAQPDGTVRLACRPEEEAAIYEGALSSPGWEHLPAVDIPVTVAASGDEAGAAGLVPGIVDRLVRGQVERWPELDHFGPMAEPDAVGEAIVRALSGLKST
jgi:pimeloyl-ACP methyl ester carboxylesterase